MLKYNYFIYSLLGLFLLFTACGEKTKKAKESYNNLKALQKVAENMEENAEKANKNREERIQKGDTIALNYEELQKFLPTSIRGYEPVGEVKGSTIKMNQLSYSVCEQEYKNAEGDKVKLSLIDYNGAHTMYTAALSVYAMGMEIDNNEQRMKGISLSDEVKGWEVFEKKQKKASVFLGVSDRFYITINADNQKDTDFAKEIAKSFPLKKLKNM